MSKSLPNRNFEKFDFKKEFEEKYGKKKNNSVLNRLVLFIVLTAVSILFAMSL